MAGVVPGEALAPGACRRCWQVTHLDAHRRAFGVAGPPVPLRGERPRATPKPARVGRRPLRTVCDFLGPKVRPDCGCTDRHCLAGRGVVRLGKECQTCEDYARKADAAKPAGPAVGVSIGGYLWPELVALQCRAIRESCGPVPVLVSWDHDPRHPGRTDAARQFAAEEGADFLTAPARLGHTAGDAAAFWRGVEWGAASGLAVVAKLSQRLVITSPRWLQSGAADLLDSGLALSTRRCATWPLRTEGVLLDVARWNQPDVLAELRRWRWADRGPDGVAFEHRLAELVGRRLGGVYWPWGLIGDDRTRRVPGVTWHDSHAAAEYRHLADGFGVTMPDDFRVSGWGWQLSQGNYSHG